MRIAGLGFRAAVTSGSLQAALEAALAATDDRRKVTALATAEDKADAAALLALASHLRVPIIAIPLASIVAQEGTFPLDPDNHHIPARYGNHSLAEAAALAAVGQGARLLSRRAVSPDGQATAAIAERSAERLAERLAE
ncbi:MAG: cobalamin biosynthesis protein [Beijerinckiaceae bacterium]